MELALNILQSLLSKENIHIELYRQFNFDSPTIYLPFSAFYVNKKSKLDLVTFHCGVISLKDKRNGVQTLLDWH